MRVSAATCRAQEAHHLALAKKDPLANRRKIAMSAAKAWGREAVLAEKREAGLREPLDKLDTDITAQFDEEAGQPLPKT